MKPDLFVVTGASGAGKSTVRKALEARLKDFTVLDLDPFIERFKGPEIHVQALRAAATGRPAILCGALIPDNLEPLPERSVFGAIRYLALVWDDALLEPRLRLRPGHEAWLTPEYLAYHLEFNRWLKGHADTTTPTMTRFDTSEATPKGTVETVLAWIASGGNRPFGLRSSANPVTGRHEIGYDDWRETVADPAGFAAAVNGFVERYAFDDAECVLPQAPADALVGSGAFRIVRRDWDWTRPWPSGVTASDRSDIRPATPGDVRTISRIINEAMRLPLGTLAPTQQVRADVFQPGWFNAILTVDGAEIAYGNAIHQDAEGTIGWLAVVPTHQRRGSGRRLLRVLLEELDRIRHERIVLTVEETNAPAIRLYESFGFTRGEGPFVHVARIPELRP